MNFNLSDVDWGKTIWLNVLRSICAGVVFFVLLMLGGDSETAVNMLALPLIYPFLAIAGIIAGQMARAGVPWIGILNLIAAVAIIPGDPLVFVLKMIVPDIVPIEKPMPINFMLVVLVPN